MLSRPTKHKTLFNNAFFTTFARQSFFSHEAKPAFYYPLGKILTPAFAQKHRAEINAEKANQKHWLDCKEQNELGVLVDALSDFDTSSLLIKRIDGKTKECLDRDFPTLMDAYNNIDKEDRASLSKFLQHQFLPATRSVFQSLAKHYGFDEHLIETSDGLLLEDDFVDLIQDGKLVLDFGETGHGPLPHIIAAFMMKELELEDKISCAVKLYQSLSQRSNKYCPHRLNFLPRFNVLLDTSMPSGMLMFGNPSSLANHLIENCDALRSIARVCKNYDYLISELSVEAWNANNDKPHLVKGLIREL